MRNSDLNAHIRVAKEVCRHRQINDPKINHKINDTSSLLRIAEMDVHEALKLKELKNCAFLYFILPPCRILSKLPYRPSKNKVQFYFIIHHIT